MNKVILIGRLTKDATITEAGETKVAKFNLAVDRRYAKGDEKTDFISCVAFNKKAEFIEKYISKGSKVVIEGEWRTGSYTNKDGQTVYTNDCHVNEIEFGESKVKAEKKETKDDEFMDIPTNMDDMPF